MFDIAVIGAGIAGLICAQQLTQAGYSVVVVEKSRGVGGRIATRRLHDTFADHGTCYLQPQGEPLERLVRVLHDCHVLEVWTDRVYELAPHQKQLQATKPSPRYIAPTGMTAIAKFLATGLEIWLNRRVGAIAPTAEDYWHFTCDPTDTIAAKAVVVAIPAPQALMLLESLSDNGLPAVFLEELRLVEFDPCLSVIAGYTNQSQLEPEWRALTFIDDPYLDWVGWDSSKRIAASAPVIVLHSSAKFAQQHLDTDDLHPAGYQMLSQAAERLLPWFNTPEWVQVHRWRYAFPRRPWQQAYLSAETPLPLVCCGDWCGGNQVGSAMLSGLAAAEQINLQLQQRALPGVNFFDLLVKQAGYVGIKG